MRVVSGVGESASPGMSLRVPTSGLKAYLFMDNIVNMVAKK